MDISDVRESLFRFINRRALELGYSDITIYPGPSVIQQDRPIWIVQQVPGSLTSVRGRWTVWRTQRFNIMFLCSQGISGFLEAERWNAHIEKKLSQNNWLITSILNNFVHPTPAVTVKYAEGGSLAAGTYYVAVSGINHLDELQETLPSVTQAVVVNAPGSGSIELVIPRYDGGQNWFSKYNVYLGTTALNMKKMTNTPVVSSNVLPTIYTINNAALATGKAPETESEIKYRFLRIPFDAFDVNVTDEPTNESGNFMAIASLNVVYPITQDTPIMEPAYPVASVQYQLDTDN